MMKTLSTKPFAQDFVFLEGPRWHDGKLWVSDMFGQAVYTLTPDGSRQEVAKFPNRPSGINFLPDGSVVIVSMADRKLMKVDNGRLSEYADLSAALPYDINDCVCAGNGDIYVGTFGYDVFAHEEPKPATLTLVKRDGTIKTVADQVQFPNGAVITPDGKRGRRALRRQADRLRYSSRWRLGQQAQFRRYRSLHAGRYLPGSGGRDLGGGVRAGRVHPCSGGRGDYPQDRYRGASRSGLQSGRCRRQDAVLSDLRR